MLITIRDATVAGVSLQENVLAFSQGPVTVRELIRRRVYHEVESHNNEALRDTFKGLVQPRGAQRTADGYRYRLPVPRRIDPEEQFERACEAFAANGFFLLVGDRQAESLDEVIDPERATTVSFVKLLPLVGG
jgi:hypothetical protein